MISAILGGVDLARLAAWGLAIAGAAATIWMHGYFRGERKLFEYQAEQAKAAVPVIVKQGKVTETVVTVYRDRVRVIEGETKVIREEIIKYVPPAADPLLPRGWVLVHDAATRGPVPPAPGGVDVTAPAVASSEALKGVADNYGACRANAAQLVSLQDWLRHQYQVMNQEPLGY